MSSASSSRSASQADTHYTPPSPPTSDGTSASSSKVSLNTADDENITITPNAPTATKLGKKKSQEEDLRLLAISTHMTELSYSISDIQTRIFEIQELRHKSQSSGDSSTTSIIDQSLMGLDERLDAVSKGMKSVQDALDPMLQSTATPTMKQSGETNENAMLLRKHATLVQEWESVQDETDVLREELKEDKWLTVFRTVTDQADGMMSSLEKAVNRCQEFIWQVHRRGIDESFNSAVSSSSQRSERSPVLVNLDVFESLLDSFEAKKKHYMPATSKVLSIIDKGVRDRVTKNGETLRRHAESAQRWRNLRERISRTDAEMEGVRKILTGGGESTPSEAGSSFSGTTSASAKNGYLATPPSGSRSSRTPSASTLSRSISPFRKFARKITGNKPPQAPVTPLTINKNNRIPSSEPIPTLRKQRTSIFTPFKSTEPVTPSTPDRPQHKHSQSFTPDSSPRINRVDVNNSTVKGKSGPKWNSSTKVEQDDRGTVKATPPKRAPSASGFYRSSEDVPPVPALGGTYRRSLSRASNASSRPWSPLSSSVSTSQSSYGYPPMPTFRPPSRAQTPSHNRDRAITPGLPTATTPRPRPQTPSHIPAPAKLRSFSGAQSEGGWDDADTSLMQRAFSPAQSVSARNSASPPSHPPRPPSRSKIPLPTLNLSTPSRPGTSMSAYRSESPASAAFTSAAARAQTPESALRTRAQQVPFIGGARAGRPSLPGKLPPSSFRDGSSSRAPSRSSSRAGSYTPTAEFPVHEYIPGNYKDPLDVEVATIVNSIGHGLLVERVDPPLRVVPREGEEVKAQYAFSNALARKVVTCKLTTLTRAGRNGSTTTKKVMCRVGGGWQDLHLYILNRQAGM